MNGPSTENAQQLPLPGNGEGLSVSEEPSSASGTGLEGNDVPEMIPDAANGPSSAFKRPVVKRTHKWGSRKGRPSKEALARRAAEEEAARIAALPPGSPGKGWGGARKGAGHPRTGVTKRKVQVTVSKEIKEQLDRLPKRTQSQYLDKALGLMLSIEPPPPEPEKEVASGEEKEQPPPLR